VLASSVRIGRESPLSLSGHPVISQVYVANSFTAPKLGATGPVACLKGFCPSFGHGVILIAGSATYPDGTHHFPFFLRGMPPARFI